MVGVAAECSIDEILDAVSNRFIDKNVFLLYYDVQFGDEAGH